MRPSGLKGNVVEELLPQYDDATNVLDSRPQSSHRPEEDRAARVRAPAHQAGAARVWRALDGDGRDVPGGERCAPHGLPARRREGAEQHRAAGVAYARRPAGADDAPRLSLVAQARRGVLRHRRDDRRADEGNDVAAVCLDRRVDFGLEARRHLRPARRARDDPFADHTAVSGHNALVSRPAAGRGAGQSQRLRGDRHVRGPGGRFPPRVNRLPAAWRRLSDPALAWPAWRR